MLKAEHLLSHMGPFNKFNKDGTSKDEVTVEGDGALLQYACIFVRRGKYRHRYTRGSHVAIDRNAEVIMCTPPGGLGPVDTFISIWPSS